MEGELTVSECAARHGVTRAAIYAAIKRGDIRSVEREGQRFIRETDCLAYQPVLERTARVRREAAAAAEEEQRGEPEDPDAFPTDETEGRSGSGSASQYFRDRLRALYQEAIKEYEESWSELDSAITECVEAEADENVGRVLAKIWMVGAGRVWTAGAEADERERRIIEEVAREFHRHRKEVREIVRQIGCVASAKEWQIGPTVSAHGRLLQVILNAGMGVHRARSLASWYLHHHGASVPIIDGAAAGKLRLMLGWHTQLQQVVTPAGTDPEYAWYSHALAELQGYLHDEDPVPTPRRLYFFLARSMAKEPYEQRSHFLGSNLPPPVFARIKQWRRELGEVGLDLRNWPQPFINVHTIGKGSEFDYLHLKEELDKKRDSISSLPATVELRGITVQQGEHSTVLRWRCTSSSLETLRALEREVVRVLRLEGTARWDGDVEERRRGIYIGSTDATAEAVREHLLALGSNTSETFEVTRESLNVWRKRGGIPNSPSG